MRLRNLGDLLRCTGTDNLASLCPSFRSKVDDKVCGLDDIQVMFNDHDRIAGLYQAIENIEQLLDVVEMKTSGGFIQESCQCCACSVPEPV